MLFSSVLLQYLNLQETKISTKTAIPPYYYLKSFMNLLLFCYTLYPVMNLCICITTLKPAINMKCVEHSRSSLKKTSLGLISDLILTKVLLGMTQFTTSNLSCVLDHDKCR